jgi:hypothetical protein
MRSSTEVDSGLRRRLDDRHEHVLAQGESASSRLLISSEEPGARLLRLPLLEELRPEEPRTGDRHRRQQPADQIGG